MVLDASRCASDELLCCTVKSFKHCMWLPRSNRARPSLRHGLFTTQRRLSEISIGAKMHQGVTCSSLGMTQLSGSGHTHTLI